MFIEVPSFPGYLVNEEGRIISMRRATPKELKPFKDKDGYLSLSLHGTTARVSRLVAEAFLGSSSLQVNHINGVRDDNRLENLEYLTHQENVQHAWDSGLRTHLRVGPKPPRAKSLPKAQGKRNGQFMRQRAVEIYALRGTASQRLVAAQFGVTPALVSGIWSGRVWKHLTNHLRNVS